jgi:NADH:ubiquinone oxidoreductase subunit 4 (subunit M)
VWELRGAGLAKTEGVEQPKVTSKAPRAVCEAGRVYWVVIGITAVSSLAMFAMSLYVFLSYSFNGDQFQGVLAFTWMENMGLLGENGIQLKVGVDGIAASLVLLTGIVVVPATWVSWKIEHRLEMAWTQGEGLSAGDSGAT